MGIVFVDHSILKCNGMMFLSRINMHIENKCRLATSRPSILNVNVVCLLNVLFWSPNENKLMHCGLFVRASVTVRLLLPGSPRQS